MEGNWLIRFTIFLFCKMLVAFFLFIYYLNQFHECSSFSIFSNYDVIQSIEWMYVTSFTLLCMFLLLKLLFYHFKATKVLLNSIKEEVKQHKKLTFKLVQKHYYMNFDQTKWNKEEKLF